MDVNFSHITGKNYIENKKKIEAHDITFSVFKDLRNVAKAIKAEDISVRRRN
jgi:ribosomal protein S18